MGVVGVLLNEVWVIVLLVEERCSCDEFWEDGVNPADGVLLRTGHVWHDEPSSIVQSLVLINNRSGSSHWHVQRSVVLRSLNQGDTVYLLAYGQPGG